MLVLMTETKLGSETGHDLYNYRAGQTYDVADNLGCQFVQKGYAKRIVTETFEESVERLKAELRAERLAREAA